MSNHNGNANKMVGEDHLPDTGKMVSDTPRTTDRVVFIDGKPWVNAPFARGLESELNAANDRIKRLEEESESNWRLAESAIGSCAEMSSHIKRLEEAGDKIVEAGWSVQDWSGMCVVWAKAKEAKP